MARKQKIYRRLPGSILTRSPRLGNRIYYVRPSLWLANDHILYVRCRRFSESYKRFYLKDIQAIVLSRTTTGRTANWIYGGVVGCVGALMLTAMVLKWPVVTWFIMGYFASSFALGLIINTLMGPTCVCRLHTEVQVEDLVSLGRLRTARKVINILKPLIEAAQGPLAPEVLYAVTGEDELVQASAHALDEGSLTGRKREIRHENGWFHTALFGLFFLCSTSAAMELVYSRGLKDLIDLILSTGLFVLIAPALTRQTHSDLPYKLKAVTWTALAVTIPSFLLKYLYVAFVYLAWAADSSPSSRGPIVYDGDPMYTGYCITAALVDLLFAVVGLVLLHRFRAAYKKSQAMPSAENVLEGG